MTRLFIVGIDGKMGRMVCKRVSEIEGFEIVGGFDRIPDMDFKIFTDVESIDVEFDAIIDFSRPETLDTVILLAQKHQKPCVLATTGYNSNDREKIAALSKKVAVFCSGNMSLGIFVMQEIVKEATRKLWDSFDIEIIEKHHNLKVDAPSGTAKMLENAVTAGSNGQAQFLYGRNGLDCKRERGEVTVHAIRGGTIVGEHEVLFAGNDELISISHTALSRSIFADGAIRAAKFLQNKNPGLYEMKDMIK